MPVIPSSQTVRERLREVLDQAERLKILLRLATELEQVKAQAETREDKSRE
jgi:sulfur transfer protein SufE